MCGICGTIEPGDGAIDRQVLHDMVKVQRHRGPDGEGDFVAPGVGLGHLRLSIIDVDGGAQPLANDDGSIQLVYNGEIYNFVELRAQLESLGHHFRTRSDTEVVVRAYEQWGRDCVRRFNGMFAFALWDSAKREIFLARDHLGIKPLYYTQVRGRVLFSSEIKALLQDPECPRELDVEALADLFTFRYVPSPKTLFRGIYKLPPGHRMTVSHDGTVAVDRYWDWVPRQFSDASEEALIAEYQDLLEDATRIQMRSDVPVGLFLSSGVDSAALLAIMSQQSATPVRAFTIGFEGGDATNEVEDARRLARRFGAEHEFQMVTPGDYERYYDTYMWDLEEPVGNESAAAFHFVSHITSRHVKVALTGQGADEPWAGYDRYKGAKLSALYSRLPEAVTTPLGAAVSHVPGRFERLKRGALSLGERDTLTRFAKMYSFFNDDMKDQLFTGELKERIGAYQPREALARLQGDVAGLDPLSQMLYIDTRASLPDDLLMVGDKMSMAHSLEARVPYLDHRIVEFVEQLPPHLRMRRLEGKYLHKKAMEKWLPEKVVWSPKKGFANPVDAWFRHRMRPFVEEHLLAPDAAVAQYFDQGYIRRLLDDDRAGRQPYRRHIYLLLSFELWHRRFLQP